MAGRRLVGGLVVGFEVRVGLESVRGAMQMVLLVGWLRLLGLLL